MRLQENQIAEINKQYSKIVFRFRLLIDCISEKNNMQVHNDKYLVVPIMPIYNLIECNDNYPKQNKKSGSLWKILKTLNSN